MNKAEQLESEFAMKGTLRGGLLLLPPTDAIDLINRSRQEGVPVLGIDGFRITAATTQPVMEHSVDFSMEEDSDRTVDVWDEAELFVRKRQHQGLVFEIVLDSSK